VHPLVRVFVEPTGPLGIVGVAAIGHAELRRAVTSMPLLSV
jgi:hypothetical protein